MKWMNVNKSLPKTAETVVVLTEDEDIGLANYSAFGWDVTIQNEDIYWPKTKKVKYWAKIELP